MKISTIQKYAKSRLSIGLMILAILGSSFSGISRSAASTAVFTKSDLFKAVFFLDGDLVNQVPTLKKSKSYSIGKKTQEDASMQEAITQSVNAMDPSYQDRLYRAVTSNDHLSISNTLKEGGELVLIAGALKVDRSTTPGFPDLSRFDLTKAADRAQAATLIKDFGDGGDVQEIAFLVIAIYYYLALWKLVVIPFAPDDTLNELYRTVSADASISHDKLVSDLVAI
ncbi:MAG: hypothetical protein IPN76_28015 [Saprospiraceae bacterium]|jgi:SdpC family antimicrobial peptide|nr:hypothetical protein [Saprospiraceae bacterium]